MKTIQILTFALTLSVMPCHAQDDGSDDNIPGWTQSAQCADSAVISQFQPLGTTGNAYSFPAGPAIAETNTALVQALAQGLGNDPVQIYNYVHDNIQHVAYYGSKKGAQLTLLEKKGNDFDQCALLVSLLKAAGYNNVGYQSALVKYPCDSATNHNDLHHWLGLNFSNTNWNYTSNFFIWFLGTRGYPIMYTGWDTNTVAFHHVWVTLTNGGNTYYLDPSFKVSEPIVRADLAAMTGLSSNSLITAVGGTTTATSVQGLSESGLRASLSSATSTLLTALNSNTNLSMDQLLSGQYIVPSTLTSLPLAFPFDTYIVSGFPLSSWSTIPTNFMSTFTISVGGSNQFWFMPQLQGQRLSLTFSNTGLAQLWLEDSLVLQTTNTGPSSTNTTQVVFTVTHDHGHGWDTANYVPINPTNDMAVVTSSYQRTNASYAIIYGFEPSPDFLKWREQKLDDYRAQGYPDTSTQVVNETLNVMGLGWLLQTEMNLELLARQWQQSPASHHRFGRMGQEQGNGYYIDVYLQQDCTFPTTGYTTNDVLKKTQVFDVSSYFGSAMEHSIIEQLQSSNLTASSTVKMLEIASTNSQMVYLANYNNWTAGTYVRTNLINYGTALSTLDSLISSGYTLLVPKNGSNHVVAGANTWAGYGYVKSYYINTPTGSAHSMGMIIAGGYHGGYSSVATTVNTPYVDNSSSLQSTYTFSSPSSAQSLQIGDPIEVSDGTLQSCASDLALGQSEPRGFNLTRYYNSALRRQNTAAMSGGWLHNYCINATPVSAPQVALGSATVQQMAPMVVATWASLNLYTPNGDARNWMTTALIAKWAVDQILNNSVSVSMGKDTIQFVHQPDGSYTPPASSTMTLTSSGGAYFLQERHGRTFKFNAAGLVTNITDPYGAQMKFTYDSSNRVYTITDSTNRALTFYYTNSALRRVADSTGRSVYYNYITNSLGQLDLKTVIDVEGKTHSFVYDASNHLILATYDALNQLVSSNIFNSYGRVTTQYNLGDTSKVWNVYWSDSQVVEQDPAGNGRTFFYDSKKRPTAVQDAYGNTSQKFYDGQDHVVMTVSPMNETNRFIYDGNHNLLQTVDPLGYSNQFIYDNQNNLIHSIDARGNHSYYGYNAQFSLTGQTNGAGDWATFTYNTDGTLHTKTDSAGTTTYSYDSYGQLNGVTYPNGLGTEGFLNDALGNVLSHTNGRAFVTSYQYNLRRQLTNTIAPTNVTASIGLDAVGNPRTTTDARGNTLTNFWTPDRHLMGTVYPGTPQGCPSLTNTYDTRDWLSRSTKNPSSSVAATCNYTNDIAGRVIAVSDPISRPTRLGYDADGRQLAATNAAGEIALQQWDSRGLLRVSTDNANHTVKRFYDPAGNQITLTNRRGKVWQFQFDAANRLTNTITPLNFSTKQSFNNRGLLQSVTDPMQRATTLGYDARGRLTSRADAVGTVNFAYDANNKFTGVTNAGDTTGLSWTNDAYDRAVSFKDAAGNLLQYRYDSAGNLTNLVYPGSRNVYYFYDALNRMTNVMDWSGRKTSFTYDLGNHITQIARPNGTLREVQYDLAGEATNIVERTTNNTPIAFFRLNWDKAARVSWEFAAPLPHTNTPPGRTNTFDDDNRLATFNGLPVVHDNNGNMTTGPLTSNSLATYGYNARNQLTGAGSLTYAYDAGGNRVAITNGTNLTRFVVNPNASLPQVLMRIQPGVTNYYIYGQGLLYEITETSASTNVLTYHYDYRGSTIAITDKNGALTDRINYYSYGLMSWRVGSTDTPFLFNGRYGVMTDPNGLYYMQARYYNPYLCRFVNPDPSGFAGGLNWYCFANGNPINMVDPFGLCPNESGSYWADVGHVFQGYGDALWGTAKGIGLAVINADETFMALGDAIASPGQTAQALWGGVENTWNNLNSSDMRTAGNAMGNVLITAATIAAPFAKAGAVADVAEIADAANPNILSGHGALVVGDSSPITMVPKGTSVTFWTEHGNTISDALGNAVESGRTISLDEFPEAIGARTYLPGAAVPNYSLFPPSGLNIVGNPTTVNAATRLSTLISPNMAT